MSASRTGHRLGGGDTVARSSSHIGGRPAEGGIGFRLHELSGGDGPTVVVLGGVHGDESQGVRAAMKVATSAFDSGLAGRLLVVPVAHEAAFLASSRTSPIDGGNLARSFPGSSTGTTTERLARLLEQEVLAQADVVVDLHSSGIHYAMAELVGFCDDGSETSRRAARAAEAMAMPVIWRHPGPPPAGRSGSGAHARGTPFLYLESPEEMDVSDRYVDAVRRLLASLGMIEPDQAPIAPWRPRHLAGPGDVDATAVRAERAGLVQLHVDLLDRVVEDQPVARFTDPWLGQETDLRAFSDGVAVVVRRTRGVGPDDLVVFLTGEETAPLGS